MATQTKFITAYGPKTKVRLDFPEPTRTHQAGKDECDINKIMARYVKTGVLDHQKEHGENYGFADSITLHDALNTVEQANTMFADLPSSLRIKFKNDPGSFLDFVQDPENKAELIEMGLAKEEQTDDQGVITTPAPPATGESGGDAPLEPAPEPETK